MRPIFNLLLFMFISLMTSCGVTSKSEIITVKDGQFIKNGEPYYFIGTNFWYGAILGSQGEGGDRERLNRELDQLNSLGVNNLRVLIGGEGAAGWNKKIQPLLQPAPGEYNDELLDGLDYFMSQLQKRDMSAVLYFANAWEWSGGYTQYLMWTGEIDRPFSPEDWGRYSNVASMFVKSEAAKKLLSNHIEFIVTRTNRYTGGKYIDDPAIFSWQICNEPRAFSKDNKEALCNWIDEASTQIRSLDPNHMISTGSEGVKGSENDPALFEALHRLENISYINAHMWSLNWKWLKIDDMDGTIDSALNSCREYLDQHVAIAESINKPLVVEEFGMPRDNASILRGTPTSHRDRLYKEVFGRIVESSKSGGVFAGCNFWAWGGDAKQVENEPFWRVGMEYSGDPAQEAQGLNSVYVDDYSTLELIREAVGSIQ